MQPRAQHTVSGSSVLAGLLGDWTSVTVEPKLSASESNGQVEMGGGGSLGTLSSEVLEDECLYLWVS